MTAAERIDAARTLHERILGPLPKPAGDEFDLFVDLTGRVLWPEVWLSDGLDLRTRSLVTVALLAAQGRDQVERHIGAALANGATRREVAEVLTHVAFYAGWPAAAGAVARARTAFAAADVAADDSNRRA